jgi:hypothetical protein
MNNGTDITSPRRRGIIVVDSSTLYRLDAPVPLGLQEQRSYEADPFYCDILRTVSNHGYEIIVPEMVALECANVLAGGMTTQHLWKNSPKGHPSCREFLRDAAMGRIPNVRVEVTSSDSQVSKLCSKFRTALNRMDLSKETRRDMVMECQSERSEACGRGLGESQAFEIMQALQSGEQVFYLTDDIRSLNDLPLALHARINVLNAKGLLYALEDQGLLRKFGLRDGPNAHEAHLKATLDKAGDKIGGFMDSAYRIDIDRAYENRESKGRPFRDSLAGLLEDIETSERRESQMGTERCGPSAVDRFLTKWKGKDKGHSPTGPR